MRKFAFSSHLPFALLLTFGCVNKEIPKFSCDDSDLAVSKVSSKDASTCSTKDAEVEIAGDLGNPPYEYSSDGGVFQSNPVFTGLWAGTYTFTVRDSKGCTRDLAVTIGAANSTLATTFTSTADTECFNPHNGAIEVTPTGGVPPYELKIDGGAFGSATSFENLTNGIHVVVVRDSENCTLSMSIPVDRGDTGTSYASEIQPILNASCNFSSCHGAGSSRGDWTVYSNVKAGATNIKNRTTNGSMPPPGSADLTSEQVQLIACWVADGAKNN